MERPPAPALSTLVTTVWIQQVGDEPLAQRHMPHGGAEVRCVLGTQPRLLGPLTTATYREIPAGGTVVGMRLRPGVLAGLVGMPADELTDQDVTGADVWREQARLTDVLGAAATPQAALGRLQSFVAHTIAGSDSLVDEVVRRLAPGYARRTADLSARLSISERQLRRRCRAAVGVGPKELQRILRLQGFIARVQASIAGHGTRGVDLARWAVEAGYHDQAHLGHECRRLLGVTPAEFLAQSTAACRHGHDHAASYVPILGRGDGRFLQERRPAPA